MLKLCYGVHKHNSILVSPKIHEYFKKKTFIFRGWKIVPSVVHLPCTGPTLQESMPGVLQKLSLSVEIGVSPEH